MITSDASGETVYGVYDSVTKKWVGRYRSLKAAVSLARDEREKIDKAEKNAAAAPRGSIANDAAQPPASTTPVPVSITVTASGEQREDASIVVFDSRGVPVAQGKTTKSGGRPKLNTDLPPGTYRIVTGWTDRQGRTHSGTQFYTVTTGKNETDLGVTEKGYTNPPRTGRPPNR